MPAQAAGRLAGDTCFTQQEKPFTDLIANGSHCRKRIAVPACRPGMPHDTIQGQSELRVLGQHLQSSDGSITAVSSGGPERYICSKDAL